MEKLKAFAPALGDAFIDAGAGLAVQTFWDVRDDQAREMMTRFVVEWEEGSTSLHVIRALNRTRRAAMSGPNGVRHPFNWAAYSVKVGCF